MKKLLFTFSLMIFLSRSLFALEVTDIAVTKNDIINSGGAHIKGRYAVSIQAYNLYDQFQKKMMSSLLPQPVKQFYISAEYNKEKSTIYYYEFKDYDSAGKVVNFIKPLIWGESRPTEMHPERIYHLNNFVVVVSSSKNRQLDQILKNRVLYLTVPESLVSSIQKRLNCGKRREVNPCTILGEFKTEKNQQLRYGKSYFGYAWSVSINGEIRREFYEVLMLKKEKDEYYGNWFPLKPDNEEEKKQITGIIKNAEKGSDLNLPEGLKDFLKGIYQRDARRIIKKTGYIYFLESKGNIAQIKFTGNKIIFLVTAEHWSGKPGPVLLGFFWNK